MERLHTPVSKRNPTFNRLLNNGVKIPESPAMPQIGMGTGVSIYSFTRSPVAGQIRSPWAIKKLNRKYGAPVHENRLAAEADVLRCLNHPNIVGFRAFIEARDGRKCLAMEECETSLGELIEKKSEATPFPVNNILTVANDVCKALSYLHNECSILHGDLKSHNVLIGGDFKVAKLCDFGVIVRLDANGVALPGEEYVGTECWTAPEILEDEEVVVTTKADIFSFGLVLWEMLALRPPYLPEDSATEDSATDEESFSEHFVDLHGTRPELPAGVTPEYDDVVKIFNWCCEADPDARPSAATLVQFLQALPKRVVEGISDVHTSKALIADPEGGMTSHTFSS